jgi:hypothetical protein
MTDKSKDTNHPSPKPATDKGTGQFSEKGVDKNTSRRDAVIDHIPPPKIPPKNK